MPDKIQYRIYLLVEDRGWLSFHTYAYVKHEKFSLPQIQHIVYRCIGWSQIACVIVEIFKGKAKHTSWFLFWD